MHIKIWSAIHTPFYEDGSIDFDGIRENVRICLARGIEGLFCNGLFGEGWAVNAEERIAIAKTIQEAAAGRAEICSVATIGNDNGSAKDAGTGSSIEETIELGLEYKKLGLDYACLITPNHRKTDKDLIQYFERQMEAIDMPFILFNSITPEGSILTPEAFAKISQNPNVRILKTTAPKEINQNLQEAAQGNVLIADPHEEKFFCNAVNHGQKIMFSDPEPYLYQTEDFRPIETYVRLLEQGEVIQARQIFDALQPLRDVYNYWFLRPFYDGIMTMAYLKKFAEIAGLAGGDVREPLKAVSPEESADMEQQFSAAMRQVQKQLSDIL